MSDIEALRDEIRHIALVAGQASIEEWDSVAAAADARFAEYCTRWADRLDAILADLSPPDLRGLVEQAIRIAKSATDRLARNARTYEKPEIARLHGEIRDIEAAFTAQRPEGA